MNNEIKKGNLNYDQSGRAYPDNPQIKKNWDCIWEKNGKHYKLVGDNEHKEWEEIENQYKVMDKEQQELLDKAYKNYRSKSIKDIDLPENLNKDAMFPIRPRIRVLPEICFRIRTNCTNRMLSREEFIGRVITNPDFAKQWGVTIYTVVEALKKL
jgi:hypothetical protein